jgi:hypothetical protein
MLGAPARCCMRVLRAACSCPTLPSPVVSDERRGAAGRSSDGHEKARRCRHYRPRRNLVMSLRLPPPRSKIVACVASVAPKSLERSQLAPESWACRERPSLALPDTLPQGSIRAARRAAQDEGGDPPRDGRNRAPRTQAQAARTHRAVPLDRLAGTRERGQPVPRRPLDRAGRLSRGDRCPLGPRCARSPFSLTADAASAPGGGGAPGVSSRA